MRGNPLAFIKYTIKAKVKTATSNDKEIKFKQVLIVREPPTNFKQMIN
jgi:hypothetical protein